MKFFILFNFLQCFILFTMAQENKSTLTINTLYDDQDKLSRRAFKYKEYTFGKVIFNDSATAEAQFNYSLLSGKILFISPKGDTLEFAHPETFDRVIIGIDTFYYKYKKYIQMISHYPVNNLALNQTVKLIGIEKKGAYGTYSGVSATNSNTTFTNDDQITTYISVDENAVYKFENAYFITDKFNNFFPATRKNFYKIFFMQEKEIRKYLDTHPVNFEKQKDLENLLGFAQSLR